MAPAIAVDSMTMAWSFVHSRGLGMSLSRDGMGWDR